MLDLYLTEKQVNINQKDHPVAIRVSAMGMITSGVENTTDYSIINKYKVGKKGKDVAVIALGDFYQLGEKVVETLAKEKGIEATLINPKFITGLDEELLESLEEEHEFVITLEDGILEGGFGERLQVIMGWQI